MRRSILALLGALALTLTLAACGGGNSGQLEQLQGENSRLEEQVSQLEEEKAALEEQLQSQTQQPSQGDSDQEEENPIDTFYDGQDSDGPTPVLDAIANSRADAWQAEAEHMAQVLKNQLPFSEDRELVDAYLTAAREQVDRMNIMAIYPISDLTLSQQDRVMTSGTLRGVLWAGSRARVWRDTFAQLRSVSPDTAYTFAFDPAAAQAELDELLQAD